MKIVINAACLGSGHKARGIGRYTQQLVAAMGRINSGHKIILTSKIDSVSGVDLIHYPFLDLFHSKLPFCKPAPREVITIHDLIPLKLPLFFKPGLRSGINLRYQKWKVRRMEGVITDSECSRRDVISVLGVSPDRVHKVYLGVDASFKPRSEEEKKIIRKKYRLPAEFVLYVGDINPNKNLSNLIKATGDLKNIPLVIVSQAMKDKSNSEAKKLYSLIGDLVAASRIIVLTGLPLDSVNELAGVYSSAALYIQPSLYEGFGLPVLEAMACGTPVVLAETSSLPEVAGDSALLVKPTEKGLSGGIKKMLGGINMRRKYTALGLARAKLFTWENTARETIRIYEEIYAHH